VCDRATDFECEQKIQLASKKLLVLIPESCFCHPSFQDMASGQIEKTRVNLCSPDDDDVSC